MKSTKNRLSLISQKLMYVLFIGFQILFVSSCKNETNKAHLTVNMTDGPGKYDAIMVDVQGVEVIGDNGIAASLNAKVGIYNLLDLSNGLDTLIATGDLDPQKVSQIRLILGSNNTIVIDGVVYALQTPSASQSGLKLQINQTFESGVSYNILLDFDASKSIVSLGNGAYQLKPVIRAIDTAVTGSIKGNISLLGELVLITATSDNAVYTSVTNVKGQFVLAGLPAGTYSVTATPSLPLLPITKSGLVVTVGKVTSTGTIVL
ncbi:MAG TPA: DUF4382 domain-containing protein [Paludibacter sp.]